MKEIIYIPPLSSRNRTPKQINEDAWRGVIDNPIVDPFYVPDMLQDFMEWIVNLPSLYHGCWNYEDMRLHYYSEISKDLDSKKPDRVVVLIDAHPGLNLFQAIALREYIGTSVMETLNKITLTGYRDEFAYDDDTCSFALNFSDTGEAMKFKLLYDA